MTYEGLFYEKLITVKWVKNLKKALKNTLLTEMLTYMNRLHISENNFSTH